MGDDDGAAAGDASAAPGWLDALKRNRALTALFAFCILAGACVGFLYLPEDYSSIRRLLGGAISGGGIAFLMTATKLM